jgi:hypothetical protein
MDEFFTRDKANEGVTLPLFRPDDGTKTEHWLKILGVDSDAYFKAETAMRRAMPGVEAEAKSLNGAEEQLTFIAEKQKEWQRKVLAAVIVDWSFEKECNEANKIEFLAKAPQIAKAVDTFISDRRLFFRLGQDSLKTSQEVSSN